MKKILIQFAHPVKTRSKMNRALLRGLEGLEGITINDLYGSYPDFMIDIEREQQLCSEHDIIIFQFPFYWYSSPSIIKEWMDLVLQHGWAYGSKGRALAGKYMMTAITAGGDEVMYSHEGFNECTIPELLMPQRATAKLCRMTWLPPFIIQGIHRGLPESSINEYSEDYRRSIIALRDDTFDLTEVANYPYLNSDLDAVIRR